MRFNNNTADVVIIIYYQSSIAIIKFDFCFILFYLYTYDSFPSLIVHSIPAVAHVCLLQTSSR